MAGNGTREDTNMIHSAAELFNATGRSARVPVRLIVLAACVGLLLAALVPIHVH